MARSGDDYPDMTSRAGPARASAWAALGAALATSFFLLPWWNRFLGLSLDGYMPYFGHRILSGEVPYRDFFLHLPPLQPLAEAALQAVVGKSILAVKLVGALGRLAIAALAAAWLARYVRPSTAVLAATFATVLISADDTEILDLYNAHSTLAALASGYLACRGLGSDSRSARRAFLLASGAAAGVCFWTKQTVGLGTTFAVPTALFLVALGDFERRAEHRRAGLDFAVGWALPTVVLGSWLAVEGALGDYFQQVFVAAGQSKGSPLVLVLRPWLAPFQIVGEARAATFGFVAAGIVVFGLRPLQRFRTARRPLPSALWSLAVVLLMIRFAPWIAEQFVERPGRGPGLGLLRQGRDAVSFFGLYGIVLAALQAAWRAVRKPLRDAAAEEAVLTLVGAAVASSFALSFAAGPTLAMPCVAYLVARAIEGAPLRPPLRFARPLVLAFLFATFVATINLQIWVPFSFAGWRESPRWESNARSTLPELAGMRLSKRTVNAVDGVVSTLRRFSDPDEPIFTFSVYPIFYWLADRRPETFAVLHWIDVTPDAVVARDLEALLARPPVAIVRQPIPDDELTLNEAYFRDGRPSAMRRMNAALQDLVARDYVLAYHSQRFRPFRMPDIEVWIRADRARERGLPARDRATPDAEATPPDTDP